jgi:hypothetical protein
MTDVTEIVDAIRSHHRDRRFAMKTEQKLDRSLESFIRINGGLNWDPDGEEADREKVNKEVQAVIKRIRGGEAHRCAEAVATCDVARAPAVKMRTEHEKAMETLAKSLPVYPWVESIRGISAPGLATIVGEAGDLSRFSKPCQLWKYLGFAPYEGLAGSTWKREKWRPRALTKDEWIENPFSGEKYALIHQSAIWLVNHGIESAKKSDTEFGRPIGPYGEIYVNRREYTKVERPNWSKQHAHMDAVRYTMKKFLKNLWKEWNRRAGTNVVLDDDQEFGEAAE